MAVKPIEEELEHCLSYMTEDNKEAFIAYAPFSLEWYKPFHENKESYTVEELKQIYRKFYKGKRLITSINDIEETLGID